MDECRVVASVDGRTDKDYANLALKDEAHRIPSNCPTRTVRAPFFSSGGGYGGGTLFLGGGHGGDAAETFEFAINFFPSTTKLVDGSIQNIQRDTIVKWEVDCAEIDPNELQSMEEKAVRKLVEKIGETVIWGPEQEVSLLRYDYFKGEYVRIEDGEDIVDEIDRQEGWASLRAELFAELVDLNIDSKVEEGNVVVVDWNAVELEEPTDLVIAPIADTEMTKLFGIPVDDRDEKGRDEANTSDNDDRELSEDVDEQLMEYDAHDEELVHVYDKENPVIRVGKL
ncbi:hypothetical protein D1007_31481 [Hordeum vulgare]|nr:hypothetical protein D1007_31481 [Hordeum vulgare]